MGCNGVSASSGSGIIPPYRKTQLQRSPETKAKHARPQLHAEETKRLGDKHPPEIDGASDGAESIQGRIRSAQCCHLQADPVLFHQFDLHRDYSTLSRCADHCAPVCQEG